MVILGPQTGHHLMDSIYSILHCPSLNGITIFGEVAIMVVDSKDHGVVNWVWDSVKQWVNGTMR